MTSICTIRLPDADYTIDTDGTIWESRDGVGRISVGRCPGSTLDDYRAHAINSADKALLFLPLWEYPRATVTAVYDCMAKDTPCDNVPANTAADIAYLMTAPWEDTREYSIDTVKGLKNA